MCHSARCAAGRTSTMVTGVPGLQPLSERFHLDGRDDLRCRKGIGGNAAGFERLSCAKVTGAPGGRQMENECAKRRIHRSHIR